MVVMSIDANFFDDFKYDENLEVFDPEEEGLEEEYDDEPIENEEEDEEEEDDFGEGFDPDNDPVAMTMCLEDTLALNYMLNSRFDGKRRELIEANPIPVPNNAYRSMFYGHPNNLEFSQPCFLGQHRTYIAGQKNKHLVRKGFDNWEKPYYAAKDFLLPKTLRNRLQKAVGIDLRDIDCMYFIGRFRYVTPYALSLLTGQRITDIVQRMALLGRVGLLNIDYSMDGPIYRLTPDAEKNLGLPFKSSRRAASLVFFKHDYLVSLVAAELERGRFMLCDQNNIAMRKNPCGWKGERVPLHGTYWGSPSIEPWETPDSDGLRPGYQLVSEYSMRSSWSKLKRKYGGVKEIVSYKAKLLNEWQENGQNDLSPELKRGGEGLFYCARPFSSKEHAPDLVVKMPRGENGQPQSICVEIELTHKDEGQDYYYRLLRSLLTSNTFGAVAYFTPNPRVAKLLCLAMDDVEKIEGINGTPGARLYIYQVNPTLGNIFDSLFVR